MSDPSPAAYVLDTSTAGDFAASLGLQVEPATARLLSGGVSSTVVALEGAPPVVLKQALAQLRVATRWDADPDRSETEAAALRVLSRITPSHVPDVLASDPASHILIVRRAPDDWQDWRTVLLGHPTEIDVQRGRTAGTVLGQWHAATWGSASVRAAFERSDAFEQLRLDPFHRELIRREAVPAAIVEPLIDELASQRQCLVHGDFSPKNILVGDDGLWVIDAEVAHAGAAVFDLAFLMAHLAIKAVNAPAHAALFERVGGAFVEGYHAVNPDRVDLGGLARHAAAVMLARVSGKSPASYLDAASAERVALIARAVLESSGAGLDALWPSPQIGARR